MLTISKEKYDSISKDYKGIFQDYATRRPTLKGAALG